MYINSRHRLHKHINNHLNIFLIVLFSFFTTPNIYAQITLSNGSFEDPHADATTPSGWFSQNQKTTPDILPEFWGVYLEPQDGNSYVGLITRPDGSYESIGQRLEESLNAEQCYRFSIQLAHSKTYANYSSPIAIQIWIGNKRADYKQMIFESPLIQSEEWREFEIEFKALEKSSYFIIRAYHPKLDNGIKGNILIDNISNIYFCDRV